MIIIDKNIMAMVLDQQCIITSEKLILLPEMQRTDVQIPEPNHKRDLSLNLFICDRVLK